MSVAQQEWFVSAPYDPIATRRGDPLGFRQAADWYANLLAPGLSNRTVDARWITILLWVLDKANGAWQQWNGGGAIGTAALAREYYELVKPLELLWVARTETMCQGKGGRRQLPGIRAVRCWLADRDLARFGMSADQYRRYRQTGIYGAYRVVLRGALGLTRNRDGWRPERECLDLTRVVEKDVPKIASAKRRGRRSSPEAHWLRAWRWDRRRNGTLCPTLLERQETLKDDTERAFLRRALFGEGRKADAWTERRQEVALLIGKSKARDHYTLCIDLANNLTLEAENEQLQVLPQFSALADAGVHAMEAIWSSLGEGVRQEVSKLAGSAEGALEDLYTSALAWKKTKGRNLRGQQSVDALANTICRAKGNAERLTAVVRHHEQYGGGLRWFALEPGGTHVAQRAPDGQAGTSPYRFRLYALGRMAVQCGLVKALGPALEYEIGEEE